MTIILWDLFLLALLAVASGLYSGSEIGFYSASRVQVDIEATGGRRPARLVRWLLRDEGALLVTILIGNNLALELATHQAEHLLGTIVAGQDATVRALIVTAALTPVIFLFGEALPKDLFRQRPHALLGFAAPLVGVSRVLFWPLERLLRLVTLAVEGVLGLESDPAAPLREREQIQTFLAEGRRHGALPARAEILARNALRLRGVEVQAVMVPWDQVLHLRLGEETSAQFERLRSSRYSRLPVVDREGRVEGYVSQLEVLQEWDGGEQPPEVFAHIRPITSLPAETPVDRALLTLRGVGRRLAIIEREGQPVGFVSLKDLLEEISGDLAGL